MKIIRLVFVLILLFQYTLKVNAQLSGLPACTGPGQGPTTAFPACISSGLSPSQVSSCSNGPVVVPACPVQPLTPPYEAVRPYWYEFTCYQAGLLTFNITPLNTNPTTGDDYDWQLYDVTGLTPAQILAQVFTNTSLVVAANWAGVIGAVTGTSSAGTQTFVCSSDQTGNPFSIRPTLIVNHAYLLLVSNFSASQQGFNLVFNTGPSTANIVNPIQPALLNATAICGNSEIRIKTNKKMICTSLALNGSDFTIIAPNGSTITPNSAEAVDCTNGKFNFDSLSVFVSAPLVPGNYIIRSKNGTDGNTIKDNCDNLIPVGIDLTFTVLPIPPAPTVVTPVLYCQNATATALTATGSNLLWYTSPTGGVGVTTLIPPTGVAGSITYYVSQSFSSCEGPRAQLVVTIKPTPALPTATTPIAYCQDSTAAQLSAVGTDLLWYSLPTGGVSTTTAPTPSTALAGTTTYYVSQTINGCEGPRKAIVVNVTATPVLPTVANLEYCKNATGIPALTAGGTNLLWFTTATGGTGSTTAPTPSTATVGTTTYYVTRSTNGCQSARAAIVVTIKDLPTAPTVTATVNYCQSATATALTATGASLLWYTSPTGGTGSSTAPTPITTTSGNTSYYVTQTVNGCESPTPRSVITVTIKPTPALPTATTPIAYCQDSTATQLSAVGTDLLWYSLPSGGASTTTAPIPSTALAGTTTYYVSQTINGCEGPRKAIVVNVTGTPTAPIVANLEYCKNATGIPALTAGGTNLLWFTTATGGTGSTTAPTPSTSSVGTTTYYVTRSTNGCQSARAAIVVTIKDLPAAPTVTVSTIDYCKNAVASPLSATGTALQWYTPLGAGFIVTTSAPTPSTVVAPNVKVYQVSQTVNGCEGPKTLITVTVFDTPALPVVTSPVAYCQNVVANQLSAIGTGLLWYTVSSGGVGTTTAPTPSTALGVSTTYYVSQTINNCEGPRAAIVVNVTATPVAQTVSTPVILCQNATATALTATGSNLKWYTVATGGSALAAAPVPSTTNVGNTVYYVSQTINGCEGNSRAAITVTVNITPPAPTVSSPIVYCQTYTAVALTTSGTNLLWYTTATGGTGTATAPVPSTATVGNTIYYVSQKTGNCEGPRAALTVTVNTTPPAPNAPSPIPYCQGAATTALTSPGTGLLWYTTATGGVGSTTAPTPSSATAGSETFYVSQTTGLCEGPRKAIVVNVTAIPAAPVVTTPVTYCQGNTATALNAPGTNLKWYTVATGGSALPSAPVPSTTNVGSTTYYVSQSVNNCEGPRAAITVDVNITPAAPIVTTPVTYCQSATTTALSAPGTNLLWYTTATGGIGSTTAPLPSSVNAGSTIYYVTQTTGSCPSVRAAITVVVNPTPALPTATTPILYCQNATPTVLVAGGTSLLWYTTATGGTGTTIAPTPSTATGGSTSYFVSQTLLGCEGPRKEIVVTVTATPTTPAVVSPLTYCQNATVTPLTSPGTNLLWYTVPTGGTGSTIAPTPLTTTVGNTNYYVTQSTNGCPSARANINVVVKITPTAPSVLPKIVCQNSTTVPLTAGGTNLLWYANATGGIGNATAPSPSTLVAGVFTFYVTQSTAGCEGPRAALQVTVTALPPKPIVVPQVNYCPSEPSVQLTATPTVVGNNLLWYTTAIGGTSSATAPTPSTANTGTTSYYVSQYTPAITGSCEGPRAEIKVVVINSGLVLNIAPPDTFICEGAKLKIEPIITPEAQSYEWTAVGVPASTIDNNTSKNITVSPRDTGTYILKAFRNGCSIQKQITVNVIWKPKINAGNSKVICFNDSALLIPTVTRKSSDSINYFWTPVDSLVTPNEVNTWAKPTLTTWYTIKYVTKPIYKCDFSDSSKIRVIVQPKVKAFAGKDTIAVKGLPHQLIGSGGINYSWISPNGIPIINALDKKALITLNSDANVYLTVKDAAGCEGKDTIFIKVYEGPTYYVPNSFTPNGDGLNDIFRATPAGMANTTYFRIFNRFGQVMFETNQWLKGWDGTFNGKPQASGTYVWIVSGTDRDNKKVEMKGTVNIIR
jgi:large repetitive protein